MAAARHLGFLKVQNFNCRFDAMRHRAKFCADRSNRCRDISDSLFYDGGRPPSLGFKSSKFFPHVFRRAKMRLQSPCQFVQIGQTLADIWTVFDVSRWRPSAVLDFQKSRILSAIRFGGPVCDIVPNFMRIGRSSLATHLKCDGIFEYDFITLACLTQNVHV